MSPRADDRSPQDLRPLSMELGFTEVPDASVLTRMGKTTVLCTASIEDRVPRWMDGPDNTSGWLTAQYSMLPGSTSPRFRRESMRGRVKGRTHEIQRLIGRSLRAVADLDALGPRTVRLDCDVLQADGGTRTASINGAFVALAHAIEGLLEEDLISTSPLRSHLAAVSCGVVDSTPMLDLAYTEDRDADVDLNLVMNGAGEFIEIQGTGEEATFSAQQLQAMLDLGQRGVEDIIAYQQDLLSDDILP